jgi:hypothetical protein
VSGCIPTSVGGRHSMTRHIHCVITQQAHARAATTSSAHNLLCASREHASIVVFCVFCLGSVCPLQLPSDLHPARQWQLQWHP